MYTYKMVIAYDGTDYHGWQIQPDAVTVVGLLERRFKDVFKKEITLIGASRTDAGVHALGQVARLSLDTFIPPSKLLFAWNNSLPKDILIRSLIEVPHDFHPQKSVKEKTYSYHFFEKRPLPFVARYGYFNGSFNKEKLLEGLSIFVGTHDFRSFCTGYEQESTVRTITAISVKHFKRYGVWRIQVQGPSFLRYMIRRIVGASLHVASSQRSLNELRQALEAKNPHQHLYVAPPQGLMLMNIDYHESADNNK